MNKSERRYDLDWLRVMVILTVFVYHSARFFNLGGWHIKNATTYQGVEIWEQFLELWIMPLCFVVSGASVYYALGKGGPGKFLKDKALRLLVPLLVGIFTHSALQVYLERVTHGEFDGSFWEFYPRYFDGMYGFGGNFGWMGIHLWYLEMLFVFSLIFLPLLLWLRRGSGGRLLARLGDFLSLPGAAILLAVPIVLVVNLVDFDSPLGMDVWGGWGILSHAWFFLSGFVLVSHRRLQASIQRLRWLWLLGGLALTVGQIVLWAVDSGALAGAPKYQFDMNHGDLLSYLWILAFVGFASRHLNFNTPGLQHANEAVLPFYILHQPVLLGVGYFVTQWAIPDLARYAIIALTSLVIIVALYEFGVRRLNLLRFLFGMKPMARPPALQPGPAVLAGQGS